MKRASKRIPLRISLVECSECGKDVYEKKTVELTIVGKGHYLHLSHFFETFRVRLSAVYEKYRR